MRAQDILLKYRYHLSILQMKDSQSYDCEKDKISSENRPRFPSKSNECFAARQQFCTRLGRQYIATLMSLQSLLKITLQAPHPAMVQQKTFDNSPKQIEASSYNE
ncbi:hypothetical protein Tco_0878140 [Tanacetum coccineum]|uniref:Uncharacterized protein n=1 Tax=Tanacetum coccineum TaxID=301880 RepID=A0ABQ5C2Y1_9ASTR